MSLISLTPEQAHARIDAGQAVLIDIREADEFARRHVSGALSRPLSAGQFAAPAGAEAIFTCRTGMRTAGACDRLTAAVPGNAYVLAGGVDAWEQAGLPVVTDAKAPLEIMRQVQIAAGSLVLIGVLLGLIVAPGWFGLAAFVGAGLTFAGATGFCGMARVLMLAPWNRRTA